MFTIIVKLDTILSQSLTSVLFDFLPSSVHLAKPSLPNHARRNVPIVFHNRTYFQTRNWTARKSGNQIPVMRYL